MLAIKTKTKKSITYLVPGPVVLNKQLYATIKINQPGGFRLRRARSLPLAQNRNRYYSIWLFYGTIDGAPDAERGAFDACLKQAEQELFGSSPKSGGDPFTRLFLELAPELQAHAKCYGSGLKRANFVGVNKEFADRFLTIVEQLYGRALELYTQRYGDWANEQWRQFILRRSWSHKEDGSGEEATSGSAQSEGNS
jgi:hypothetical protein